MRRMILLGATSVLMIATLNGCATTEQSVKSKGLTPMSQKELEDRFKPGRKMSFDNQVGGRGTAAFNPDGTVTLTFPGGGGDTGKWLVKDGKVCTKYSRIRNGEELCVTSYKTGLKEYTSFAPDGSLNSVTTDID